MVKTLIIAFITVLLMLPTLSADVLFKLRTKKMQDCFTHFLYDKSYGGNNFELFNILCLGTIRQFQTDMSYRHELSINIKREHECVLTEEIVFNRLANEYIAIPAASDQCGTTKTFLENLFFQTTSAYSIEGACSNINPTSSKLTLTLYNHSCMLNPEILLSGQNPPYLDWALEVFEGNRGFKVRRWAREHLREEGYSPRKVRRSLQQ